MSDVGDRLKERFTGLRIRIVVPEWRGVVPDDSRGDPAVYAQPFTLQDSTNLSRWIADDSPEGFAQVVLRKAENESGDRLFDIRDREVLVTHCEAHIVSRVGREIMASVVDVETAAGN